MRTANRANGRRLTIFFLQSLKETFKASLPEKIEQIKKLKKEHGSKVIGEVTLDQVYGGARGIKSLVWEVRRPYSVLSAACLQSAGLRPRL